MFSAAVDPNLYKFMCAWFVKWSFFSNGKQNYDLQIVVGILEI